MDVVQVLIPIFQHQQLILLIYLDAIVVIMESIVDFLIVVVHHVQENVFLILESRVISHIVHPNPFF